MKGILLFWLFMNKILLIIVNGLFVWLMVRLLVIFVKVKEKNNMFKFVIVVMEGIKVVLMVIKVNVMCSVFICLGIIIGVVVVVIVVVVM